VTEAGPALDPRAAGRARPRRVIVIGVSSTGKSTLARRLAVALEVPVVHLDNVADALGHADPSIPHSPIGEFPDHPFVPRPLAERRAIVAELAAGPDWVAEGPYIEWIRPLLDRADTIVWLDQLGPLASVRGAIRRALATRRRTRTTSPPLPDEDRLAPPGPSAAPGVLARLRSPIGKAAELWGEVWDVAGYHWWRRVPGVDRDIRAGRWDRISRRQVAGALGPHADRVVRVRSWPDLDLLAARITAGDAGAGQPPSAAR
jgi:hypothetical protein